jgi:hypothetical protein
VLVTTGWLQRLTGSIFSRGERAGMATQVVGPASGLWGSATGRPGKPVTGRAATARDTRCSGRIGAFDKHHSTHSATPHRKVRIESIEGVLGRAYRVTLNGARYNRPWRDGSALHEQIAWVCFGTPGRVGSSKERSKRHRSRDMGCQIPRRLRYGLASAERRRRSVAGSRGSSGWLRRALHANPTPHRPHVDEAGAAKNRADVRE